MKYITRLTETNQVKLMVAALEKVLKNQAKFEVDFNNSKSVRISKPDMTRPLYFALCKGGDTWVTSYPDNLFV
jgi:hypothetical protein